ncbi:MAG: ATP-binding cassette domain-containing protein, partial [Acidimicrobiia bacterium]|nr:ATP-binding cassette domain-containing protein [Acidimicrobiia bacterium]
EARSAARDWLCHIGYEDLTGRKGSALSGGERQVVALGRAVIHQPDLVVLDEPFAALDAAARPAIRRLVASLLADNDGPALVVTHDPADAAVLADRVVVVEGGRVTQTGTVADLRAHPGSQYVADLVGVNILHGRSIDGVVTVDGEVVSTATEVSDGEVMLVIHPRAVGLYPERPRGSARNVWRSVVTAVEPMGGSVRVLFDDPWSIAAEVTTTGAEAVGAAVGLPLWISVKASEVAVTAPGV